MKRPALFLLAIVAAGSLALPAVAKNAKPKSNGGYISAFKKSGFSGITLTNGKITQLIVNARYKKNGKACTNSSSSGELNYIVFQVKKPKKAGTKFNVTGRAPTGTVYAGASARIKGRFTSSSQAKFTASAKWNGCKTGKIKIKKATYRSGG